MFALCHVKSVVLNLGLIETLRFDTAVSGFDEGHLKYD